MTTAAPVLAATVDAVVDTAAPVVWGAVDDGGVVVAAVVDVRATVDAGDVADVVGEVVMLSLPRRE